MQFIYYTIGNSCCCMKKKHEIIIMPPKSPSYKIHTDNNGVGYIDYFGAIHNDTLR